MLAEKDADPRTIIDPNFMMQYRELQKYVSATKISNQDAVAAGLLRNPFVECSADWHGAGSPAPGLEGDIHSAHCAHRPAGPGLCPGR